MLSYTSAIQTLRGFNRADYCIVGLLIAIPCVYGLGELLFGLFSIFGCVIYVKAAIQLKSFKLAWKTEFTTRVNMVVLALFLFYTLKALSLLWSDHRQLGLRDLGTHLHFLLFPFIYAWLKRAHKPIDASLIGISIALLALTIQVIFLLLSGLKPSQLRYSAATGNALVLAFVLNLYLTFFLTRYFFKSQHNISHRVMIAITMMYLLIIYANWSRSAWVQIFIIILVIAVFKSWKHLKTHTYAVMLGLPILISLVIFSAWSITPIQEHLLLAWSEWIHAQAGSSHATSLGLRYMMYKGAWTAFTQAPWIGYGVGSVQTVVAPLTAQAHAVTQFNHVHNQFLQTMVELGVMGLAAYVLIFISCIYAAWSKYLNPNNSATSILITLLLVVTNIQAMSNIVFKQGLQNTVLLSLIAIALADLIRIQSATQSPHVSTTTSS